MTPKDRRTFIRMSIGAAAASAIALPRLAAATAKPMNEIPKINIFSKHLQFLDYKEMARAAREIGFDGVDLTVRPGGHVLPENVSRDLPRAIEAVREEGLSAPMITTAVDDADDRVDRQVLSEAAKLGVKYYRMNWFPYPKSRPIPEAIEMYRSRIQALATLNEELGLVGCYQNHAGLLVGASLWEIWQILQGSDPKRFGVQYDIRHATVEGGLSWPNGFRLVSDRIQTLAIKDFKWMNNEGGAELVNTPVGEGMVDFKRYFALLKETSLDAPVSLHFEYDIGGAQWGERSLSKSHDYVFEAMKRDLATTKRLWSEA